MRNRGTGMLFVFEILTLTPTGHLAKDGRGWSNRPGRMAAILRRQSHRRMRCSALIVRNAGARATVALPRHRFALRSEMRCCSLARPRAFVVSRAEHRLAEGGPASSARPGVVRMKSLRVIDART